MTTELMEISEQMNQNFTVQLKNTHGYITSPPVHTCGGTGGWRRAVYLDMTDPNTGCPYGWNMTDCSKRTCGRASDGQFTCDSVTYPVYGGEYSQVCGRIKAYQWGWAGGFGGYSAYNYGQHTLDSAYFNGVAAIHGSPRQHIWTFSAGAAENYPGGNWFLCPCDVNAVSPVPPFINDNYFCESGYIHPTTGYRYTLHSDDPLWDGSGCHSSSTCCSLHDPPYFTKTLNTTTTDDIELRLCVLQDSSTMDIAVEFIC